MGIWISKHGVRVRHPPPPPDFPPPLIFTSPFSSGALSVDPWKDLPAQQLPPRAHGPGRHADASPPHHRHHQDGRNEEARLPLQPRRIASISQLRGFARRPIRRWHHADPAVSGAKPSRWPTVSNLFICSSVIFRPLAPRRNSFTRSHRSCPIHLPSQFSCITPSQALLISIR